MTPRKTSLLAAVVVTVGLTAGGCGMRQQAPAGDVNNALEEKQDQIEALESSLRQKDETVHQLESQLKSQSVALSDAQKSSRDAEQRTASAEAQMSRRQGVSPADVELLPPDAEPGECYARVFIPPTYETYTEDLLKREASEKIEIVPARYEWTENQVLAKEASERLEVVPAVYETKTEKVLVKPAGKEVVEVPAVYETVTEKVLVKPAHKIWKKGRGPVEKLDEATGEIMCLVEVPAEYKTVTKKVLKTPATTKEKEIPAVYETITKKVVKTPASVRRVEVPAEYDALKVRTLVEPARETRTPVPVEYQTVSRRRQVTDGYMQWRPVLCETNMTQDVVMSIQRSLRNAGHDPGPIDGIIGTQTMSAVRSYQEAKDLARGGLTLATLDSLGITGTQGVLRAQRDGR